jgi:glycerate 2-kinase
MRIVVVSDRIGELSSRQAGELIAAGWPDAEARVVPAGEAGHGFVDAFADAFGGAVEQMADPAGVGTLARTRVGTALEWEPSTPACGPIPYDASSSAWGKAVQVALSDGPTTLYVDLVGPVVHDAGAGALAALGARADVPLDRGVGALSGLAWLDLDPVRERLGGTHLVGVVPESELSARLLGLRGITSRLGREHGEDPERMLAVDASLERLAARAAPEAAAAPGAGACGGLGFAVFALGGRLSTGPGVTLSTVAHGPRPDLVLTGCTTFDFARRGGGVVAEAVRLATAALCPCVVLAGEVFVGSREMRAMGIESAYGVLPDGAPSPVAGWSPGEHELAELARRVARTWRW